MWGLESWVLSAKPFTRVPGVNAKLGIAFLHNVTMYRPMFKLQAPIIGTGHAGVTDLADYRKFLRLTCGVKAIETSPARRRQSQRLEPVINLAQRVVPDAVIQVVDVDSTLALASLSGAAWGGMNLDPTVSAWTGFVGTSVSAFPVITASVGCGMTHATATVNYDRTQEAFHLFEDWWASAADPSWSDLDPGTKWFWKLYDALEERESVRVRNLDRFVSNRFTLLGHTDQFRLLSAEQRISSSIFKDIFRSTIEILRQRFENGIEDAGFFLASIREELRRQIAENAILVLIQWHEVLEGHAPSTFEEARAFIIMTGISPPEVSPMPARSRRQRVDTFNRIYGGDKHDRNVWRHRNRSNVSYRERRIKTTRCGGQGLKPSRLPRCGIAIERYRGAERAKAYQMRGTGRGLVSRSHQRSVLDRLQVGSPELR